MKASPRGNPGRRSYEVEIWICFVHKVKVLGRRDFAWFLS